MKTPESSPGAGSEGWGEWIAAILISLMFTNVTVTQAPVYRYVKARHCTIPSQAQTITWGPSAALSGYFSQDLLKVFNLNVESSTKSTVPRERPTLTPIEASQGKISYTNFKNPEIHQKFLDWKKSLVKNKITVEKPTRDSSLEREGFFFFGKGGIRVY